MKHQDNHNNESKTGSNSKNSDNSTKAQVQEAATETLDTVKQQASQVTQKAQETAQATIEQQKKQAASNLRQVAGAFRSTSSSLEEVNPTIAHYTNEIAKKVETVSSYMTEQDLEGMINDTRDFAHKRPELFIGGAFFLGLAVSRFLKSSSPDANTNRGGNYYSGSPRTHYRSDYPSSGQTYTAYPSNRRGDVNG